MRATFIISPVRRVRLIAVVVASLVGSHSAIGQEFHFGVPPQAELTTPQIAVVSGPTAARLEQARALAADENWQEAVEVYRDLAADDTDRVVALDDRRYVTLRTYCHVQISRLPAEALADYRRRVDPLAERWYREGLAARDERLLRRVVDEMFCSSWSDDALLALGELALERADYAAARRWWQKVSPLLRAANGLPPWLALRDVDLDDRWHKVERQWLDRSDPPKWLAYPDTELDLAEVRARLVLVSIRAGELDRAAWELVMFRRLHPDASGWFGGQQATYAATLERLLASAQERLDEPREADWPTFAGSTARSHIAPPVGPIERALWQRPLSLAAGDAAPAGRRIIVGSGRLENAPQLAPGGSQRPLSCFPVVVDQLVVFADDTAIRAVDLASGEPAVTASGVLYRNDSLDESPAARTIFRPGAGFATAASIAHGVPRHTLTVADGIVYGRVGRLATTRVEARETTDADRLVGLDLSRDGLLSMRLRPPSAEWSFDGVPVSDGRRLFVAMRRSDVAPHAYVACFDVATGLQLWRTAIGAADTPAGGQRDEITHNLLTLVGNRIFFNTNLGLVAALDVDDGRIRWVHRYDRLVGRRAAVDPLHFDRGPAPCLYHDGLLIVAASDAPSVFALDADSGQSVWITDQMPDALDLLGVVGKNLIIGGNRLRAVDVRSGELRFTWPEAERGAVRGMGRGLIAGEEIFWPTRNEIHVLDAVTGEPTRPPIGLAAWGGHGANLVAAPGYLLVATPDQLVALGSRKQ